MPKYVQKLGWALQGAAAAISMTNLVQPILLFLYVRFAIPHSLRCWPGFSWNAFKNWGPMVRLAVPGILTVEAEWLAWDILTFSSAYLGKTYLAAQSVLFNVSILVYHLPMPASIAASTRLGNLIGCGALDAARVAVTTYYFIFLGIGLFNLSFLVAMKDVIPRIFSNDFEVRNVVSLVMPICAAFQLVDSTTSLCNGLLRGLGLQYIGGWTNLVVYYGVSSILVSAPYPAMSSTNQLLVLHSCFTLPHVWPTTSWTLGFMDWTGCWPCCCDRY